MVSFSYNVPEDGFMIMKHVMVLTTQEINKIYLNGDLHPTPIM
jgi:hypothetical protein